MTVSKITLLLYIFSVFKSSSLRARSQPAKLRLRPGGKNIRNDTPNILTINQCNIVFTWHLLGFDLTFY